MKPLDVVKGLSVLGAGAASAGGEVMVAISKDGQGHPPEFWAERLTALVIRVSDTAPQPIRDQAHTFKEAIYAMSLSVIRQAMESAAAHSMNRKTGV